MKLTKGGYYMIDCTGLDLAESDPQTISGTWDKARKAIKADKPIFAYGCKYGLANVTPTPVFGWYISADKIVLVGATLHVEVTDGDVCTVIDVVSP